MDHDGPHILTPWRYLDSKDFSVFHEKSWFSDPDKGNDRIRFHVFHHSHHRIRMFSIWIYWPITNHRIRCHVFKDGAGSGTLMNFGVLFLCCTKNAGHWDTGNGTLNEWGVGCRDADQVDDNRWFIASKLWIYGLQNGKSSYTFTESNGDVWWCTQTCFFVPMFSPLQLLGTAYFLSETGELLMMVSAVKYLERPCAAQEEIKLETLDWKCGRSRNDVQKFAHKNILLLPGGVCGWLEVGSTHP